MKLLIAQFLLEQAQFKHAKADFLAQDPATPATPTSGVSVQAQLLHDANEKPEEWKSVGVRLRLTSDPAADALYVFDVSYIVLLSVDHEGAPPPPAADLTRILVRAGATMAMPFAREVVANLTSRGRFGPTWVSPVNFAELGNDADAPPPQAEAVAQ